MPVRTCAPRATTYMHTYIHTSQPTNPRNPVCILIDAPTPPTNHFFFAVLLYTQTFVFVKGGEIQGKLVGANPEKLREAIFRYL